MTTQTANGHGASAVRYVIEILTKRGKTWAPKTDGSCKSADVAIVAAESFLGRKFPQRIAVRVVDSSGRKIFQRVKPGCEVPVILAGAREDIVGSYASKAEAA